jgi:hypothetical protein
MFSPLYYDFDMGMSDDAAMPADCFNPPTESFGDPMTIAIDETTYPLANPHDQPAGSTLRRTHPGP